MSILRTERQFHRFREQLYQYLEHRRDSAMDLLDALCSNDRVPSVVELSLNPLFRRKHGALYKAIGETFTPSLREEDVTQSSRKRSALIELIAQIIPHPQQRSFHLWGLDCTPLPRPYAPTLEDRGMVYQPTPVQGNKPITIGHSYSMLASLPERQDEDPPWTIPTDIRRVPSEGSGKTVGQTQVNTVLSNPDAPWSDELSVLVVDSDYGNKTFLGPLQDQNNLVTVARVRSNRVFYQSPPSSSAPSRRGHPTWYGERFDLKDEETWHPPDEIAHTSHQTRRGRTIEVTISAWPQMLMRGGQNNPMHQLPFTLLRIESVDASGELVFKPMWLIVMGKRRGELSPLTAYLAYRQRFDLEHTFRFQKQNLLLSAFETADVDHEQSWVQLVMLASLQLWAAHGLAKSLPRPWESYLNNNSSACVSPSKVQQDWNRIISQLGSPARPPKPRGKSSGRRLGQTQTPRPRLPVIKKSKSQKPTAKKAA